MAHHLSISFCCRWTAGFVGTIPTELGLISGITNLGMEGNRLTGTVWA